MGQYTHGVGSSRDRYVAPALLVVGHGMPNTVYIRIFVVSQMPSLTLLKFRKIRDRFGIEQGTCKPKCFDGDVSDELYLPAVHVSLSVATLLLEP